MLNFDENYRYAGFWLRFFAVLIDGLITYGFSFLAAMFGFIIAYNVTESPESYDPEALASTVFGLVGLIVPWLYYAVMESSKRQATFGKMLLRLRVVDLNGNRISFGRASGRYFGKFLSFFTLIIGYLMAGWTRKKQGLHDKLAGCLVVKNNSRVF